MSLVPHRRLIREEGYTGLIIGLTGDNSSEDIHYFKARGADEVLPKPFVLAEFEAILRAHAGRRQQHNQRQQQQQQRQQQQLATNISDSVVLVPSLAATDNSSRFDHKTHAPARSIPLLQSPSSLAGALGDDKEKFVDDEKRRRVEEIRGADEDTINKGAKESIISKDRKLNILVVDDSKATRCGGRFYGWVCWFLAATRHFLYGITRGLEWGSFTLCSLVPL